LNGFASEDEPQVERYPVLTGICLLLANLVPVGGVLFLGWDVGALLFLYWSENVVIGLYTVLCIIACEPQSRADWFAKIPAVLMFLVHYGLYCYVSGAFVVGMFPRDGSVDGMDVYLSHIMQQSSLTIAELNALAPREHILQLLNDPGITTAIAGLLISYGLYFIVGFLFSGEYRSTDPNDLMMKPYGRVILLNLTLGFGGYLSLLLGSPIGALLFLTFVKVMLDLKAAGVIGKDWGIIWVEE